MRRKVTSQVCKHISEEEEYYEQKIIFAAAALAAVVTLGTVAGNTVYAADSVSITNVSYDPTRELYEQYNKIFQEHWKEKTGQDVDITQSHGGSGKQHLRLPMDWKRM